MPFNMPSLPLCISLLRTHSTPLATSSLHVTALSIAHTFTHSAITQAIERTRKSYTFRKSSYKIVTIKMSDGARLLSLLQQDVPEALLHTPHPLQLLVTMTSLLTVRLLRILNILVPLLHIGLLVFRPTILLGLTTLYRVSPKLLDLLSHVFDDVVYQPSSLGHHATDDVEFCLLAIAN